MAHHFTPTKPQATQQKKNHLKHATLQDLPMAVLPLKVLPVFLLLNGVLWHFKSRHHLISSGFVAEAITRENGTSQFLQLVVHMIRVYVLRVLNLGW